MSQVKPRASARPRPKLDRPAVQARITELLAAGPPDAGALLAFAEWIHGKPFAEPALSLTQLKAAVCVAKERARRKAGRCAVTQQIPKPAASQPIELDVHHLFDASSRPDLAAFEDNLLVITSGLHRNFHKWMDGRPCEPRDFVDYLLRNELTHFQGSPSIRVQQEKRQQKLIHQLELLQARFEGNRLLY